MAHTGAAVFWRGRQTHRVPMEMYAQNRARLCTVLREDTRLGVPLGVALLQGGVQQARHDTDHEPLFRQVKA